jgi:hypothetical protein
MKANPDSSEVPEVGIGPARAEGSRDFETTVHRCGSICTQWRFDDPDKLVRAYASYDSGWRDPRWDCRATSPNHNLVAFCKGVNVLIQEAIDLDVLLVLNQQRMEAIVARHTTAEQAGGLQPSIGAAGRVLPQPGAAEIEQIAGRNRDEWKWATLQWLEHRRWSACQTTVRRGTVAVATLHVASEGMVRKPLRT